MRYRTGGMSTQASVSGAAPGDWYRLDNAAKAFAPALSRRYTTLFRVAVVLNKPVRVHDLQRALDRCMKRFPYYQVHLRPGFFWYYFEENPTTLRVRPDPQNPCMRHSLRRRGSYLLRVRCYHCRISVEFSHALTDGFGALQFLNTLLCAYHEEVHGVIQDWGSIIHPESARDPQETEDSFLREYVPHAPAPVSASGAWHLPYRLLPAGIYRVCSGVVPAGPLRAAAKERGGTVNDFLTAVYCMALQSSAERLGNPKRPVRVFVPVNLRAFFPSRTMRNFFSVVSVELDLRLGHFEFEEIFRLVFYRLRLELNEKNLRTHLKRNVKNERNPVLRVVPRTIKDRLVAFVYKRVAEGMNTASISNLGRVSLPSELEGAVDRYEFLPPPSPMTKINCAVIGFGDEIVISFGRMIENSIVEMYFFRTLRELGIPARIHTNWGGD